ncbi:MAG: methyl-accepting chemotaxis protein [Acidobacteriota bacterium]
MSVSAKLILPFIAVFILAIVALEVVTIQNQKAALSASIEKRAETLARSLSLGLGDSFYARQYNRVQEALEEAKRADEDLYHLIVVAKDGLAVASTDSSVRNQNLTRNDFERNALEVLDISRLENPALGIYEYIAPITTKDTRLGVLRVGVSGASLSSTTTASATLIAIAGLAALILGALVYRLVLTRGVLRQVYELNHLAALVEQGDTDRRAKVVSGDELGRMAEAFNLTLDRADALAREKEENERRSRALSRLLDAMNAVIGGDLTREAEVTNDLVGSVAETFNKLVAEMRDLVKQVQGVALVVSSAANEGRTTTDYLAQGSQEQALQINTTSSALDEMSASLQHVNETAVLSTTVAEQSLVDAKKGAEMVQTTMRGMARIQEQVQETAKRIMQLGERSQEIGEIVQLIEEIADRTSILALNASIQTAGGGAEQGFAVVAEEVERLAGRASEATKRIANLVKSIQTGTNEAIEAMEKTTREVIDGAKLVGQARQSLTEIETVSGRLAELVNSITQASRQQARGSENLYKSVSEIARITQQTATGVRQSADTVRHLATLADQLQASVAAFRLPQGGNGSAHRM